MELEWVDFEPREGQRIAFYEKYGLVKHLRAWACVGGAGETLTNSPDATHAVQALDELCESLAVLVADWDLHDDDGPLPKPNKASAFYNLSIEAGGELKWIMEQLGERLNPNPES